MLNQGLAVLIVFAIEDRSKSNSSPILDFPTNLENMTEF